MVTKNRVFISILVLILGVIILFGVYTKRKFYDPKHRLENAKKEVRQLAKNDAIQNGDLIFQTSLSGQSKAIQLATNSKYSHCGIIFIDNDEYYVFEAIQPVRVHSLISGLHAEKMGITL